ncbi:MAG: hypothetical protein COT18_12480 [Elusimicrobia bacterium CG08_land_8_20_14_0_20_59_10]|nr:MAG: hypothetical protein COT18_12480 [Elusimicrobia bacterium CG08_land_8_20_14_0_20_59_10]
MFRNYYSEMKAVKEKACALGGMSGGRPRLGPALANFRRRAKFSARLIFLEKELIIFAVLQWLCVAAGYYLWVQMIGWIPAAAWERASNSNSASVGDLVLFAWSFVCVGLTAFPLGLLSGCMGAVHFLNRQGRESTIAECFKMVLPKVWPLWIFHWIDGWWTVMRILDRLPKKNDRRTPAQKALSEAIYYAWKLATIGILPALVTGRGLVDAGKRSVLLVQAKFLDVAFLRAGYSAACWIIGIAAYAGTIVFFVMFPQLLDLKAPVESRIFTFYLWAGLPIVSATGIVMLFLRPVYIISACDIYAGYVREREENLMLPPPPRRGGMDAFIAFFLLALAVLIVVFYRYELGIMDWLSR